MTKELHAVSKTEKKAQHNRTTHSDVLFLTAWMPRQSREYLEHKPDTKIGEDAAAEMKRPKPLPASIIAQVREHLGIKKSPDVQTRRTDPAGSTRIRSMRDCINIMAKDFGASAELTEALQRMNYAFETDIPKERRPNREQAST